MKGEGTQFGSWNKAIPPVRVRGSNQRNNREFRALVSIRSDEALNLEGWQEGELEGIEVELADELEGELERNGVELEVDNEVIGLVRNVKKGKGISPSKPNIRKWKRAARQVLSPKDMVGLSSPIQRILIARQLAKSEGNSGGNSPTQKSTVSKVKMKTSPRVSEQLQQALSCKNRLSLSTEEIREGKKKRKTADLGFVGSKMTWINRRDGDANVHERIDRLLADCSWIDLFPKAKVQHLGFNSSDHRPLLLDFEEGFRGEDMKVLKTFKFEPS
ncbi:hypothetical protein Q3G72_001441 [Acer saccharum]|nr:hypothetical protein Q3G72_001441 [Acer saccharum]